MAGKIVSVTKKVKNTLKHCGKHLTKTDLWIIIF